MTTDLNNRDSKLERAQEAFENYDFGVFNIEDQEGWDTSDPLDYIRVAYAVSREDEMCSYKVSFHVRFNAQGIVVEAYGLECRTGNYIGHDPIVRVEIGPEGTIHEIDMRSLSRDSGFVVITAEINGSTEYLIATDVSEAAACINGVGGKIVDVTTNLEEVINSQYEGVAVLSTNMGVE
jgi:hypothetical protein